MSSKFSGGNFSKSFLDTRDDLGYGRYSGRYHLQKALGGDAFPYVIYDDVDDIYVDDESIDAVLKNTEEPHEYDSLPFHDPFYFFAGNTKMKESLSPIPDLYKNRDGAFGGTRHIAYPGPAYGFRSISRPTGEDWSRGGIDDDEDADAEDIYNLEDVALNELRSFVSRYILRIT